MFRQPKRKQIITIIAAMFCWNINVFLASDWPSSFVLFYMFWRLICFWSYRNIYSSLQDIIFKYFELCYNWQCRANIRIYSDIQIFVYKYWIFEYEYWKFDFSNIFVFIFGQKLSFVKGEYSNIFGYSNVCLRILDIRIRISEIWLSEYIRIRVRSKNQYSP